MSVLFLSCSFGGLAPVLVLAHARDHQLSSTRWVFLQDSLDVRAVTVL